EAFSSQELLCWVSGHTHAFEFMGGCHEIVVYENVPRNIFVVLCPTALCGSNGNRPEAVLVTSRCRSFRGT
ncbi:MAG: hypothetical protein ABSB52_14970, partial [Acidimicrobiales bacterium]